MVEREIVFIDANIFLEIILRDQNSESCKLYLKNIIEGEINAVTSDFIIYTCLLQIQHKLKSISAMNNFLLFLNELQNISILRPNINEIQDTLKISERYKLDFDDSLVVSCMVNNDIKTLISFDKDFDKVHLIKRKMP